MNTQYCFLKLENVPTREELQKVIDELGYELKLDPELNLKEDEGFSLCQINGYDNVGYELEFGAVDEIFEEDEEFEKYIGDRDAYISMSWGGSFADCLAVSVTTLALVKSFGAVTTYDCEVPDSIEDIETGIEECKRELNKIS